MRQLSLFKGKQQRGVRAPPPLEFASHVVIADICRRWLMPHWRFTHMPMGEHRTKITAIRLHRMGVTAGWPDFAFFGPQCAVFWLELKRARTGRLSDEQVAMHAFLAACGHGYLCTASVPDAIETLKALGIVRAGVEVQ